MVVCSILESGGERTLRRIGEAPEGCGLVEVRGDRLGAEELAAVVRGAGRELIVTLRNPAEGGEWSGSEEERGAALRAALDAGARYVDLELEGAPPGLLGTVDPERVILSHHGARCTTEALREVHRRMAAQPAAVLKIVPACDSLAEAGAVREFLKGIEQPAKPVACFALGRAGMVTRILAPSWGSWASYGSAVRGAETAPGQLTASELLDLYRVTRIGDETRRFALIGSDISRSPSPAMHRGGYDAIGIDACFLPLELDRFEEGLAAFGPDGFVGLSGLAVTMPFKEEAADRCERLDPLAARAGAVNTLLAGPDGWSGANTDGPAVVDLARRSLDPSGKSAAVVGAGGTARAAAAALVEAGASVTLYNRTLERAQEVARSLGVEAAPLERLARDRWELLVQGTPVGRGGERLLDGDALCGRFLLDAVYGRETPLVADARARGIPVADGLDLLVAQGVRQFELMTGRAVPAEVMRRSAEAWLATVDGPGDNE